MSTLDIEHAETEHPATTTNAASGKDMIRRQRRRRRLRRSSMAGCSSETTTDGSFKFSDTSEDEYHSWHSSMGYTTTTGGDGGGGGGDGVGDSGSNRSIDACTLHGSASGFHAGPCKPGRRGSWGKEGVGDNGSLVGCTPHGGTSGFHAGPCKPGRRGSWGEEGVGDNGSLVGCTPQGGTSGFHAGPCKPGRRGSWGEEGVGDNGSLVGCTPHGGPSGFHAGPCKPGRSGSWGEEEVDLESGELEMSKSNNDNKEEGVEKDCRICHLSLMENGIGDDLNGNGGIGIELGCACKGDLGNAHKQCAETWFKIKGNITCEICGAIAINVAGDKAPDLSSATAAAQPANVAFPERQNYCHGRRIMNFLLACMIFAFVISWLFHFNVLS